MESIHRMVQDQVEEVLRRGQRYAGFDRIRNRHFWSSRLFAYGSGNPIPAGPYDIFKTIPSAIGQGYPVPLTTRETNWLNAGRVPDNQNVVITEIGVTVKRPPAVDSKDTATAPSSGIFANLPDAIQALISPDTAIHPTDAETLLSGIVLEMTYLTNAVPIGLCRDFSQSAGAVCYTTTTTPSLDPLEVFTIPPGMQMGDPTNGIAAAAFRRRLEVPIMLQHGESMSMRLNIPRALELLSIAQGGAGWAEIRVDWWGIESFTEKS